jgi:hypothetical protein
MLHLHLDNPKLHAQLKQIHNNNFIQIEEVVLKNKDLYIQNNIKATLSYHLDPKRFDFGIDLLDQFYTEIHEGRYKLLDEQTDECTYQGLHFNDAVLEFEPNVKGADLLTLINERKRLEQQLSSVNKSIVAQLNESGLVFNQLIESVTAYHKQIQLDLQDMSIDELSTGSINNFVDIISTMKDLVNKLQNTPTL